MPSSVLMGFETTTGKQAELLIDNGELRVSAQGSGGITQRPVTDTPNSISAIGVFVNETGTANYKSMKCDANGHLLVATDSSADSIQVVGNTTKDGTGTSYHLLLDADGKLKTSYPSNITNALIGDVPTTATPAETPKFVICGGNSGISPTGINNAIVDDAHALRTTDMNLVSCMELSGGLFNKLKIKQDEDFFIGTDGTLSTVQVGLQAWTDEGAAPYIRSVRCSDKGQLHSQLLGLKDITDHTSHEYVKVSTTGELSTVGTSLLQTDYSGTNTTTIFLNADTGLGSTQAQGALNVALKTMRIRNSDNANPISVAAGVTINSSTLTIESVDTRQDAANVFVPAQNVSWIKCCVTAITSTQPTTSTIQVVGFSGDADVYNFDVIDVGSTQWVNVGTSGGVTVWSMTSKEAKIQHDHYFVGITNNTPGSIPYHVNWYLAR